MPDEVPPPLPPEPPVGTPSPSAETGLPPNVAAGIACVLPLVGGIVFLMLEKRDAFVRFHAMQSILYSAAGIVFRIGWSILVSALVNISGWVGLVLVPVGLVISLGLFAFWIYLMYQAYSNREFRIPVIGAIAAKQAG